MASRCKFSMRKIILITSAACFWLQIHGNGIHKISWTISFSFPFSLPFSLASFDLLSLFLSVFRSISRFYFLLLLLAHLLLAPASRSLASAHSQSSIFGLMKIMHFVSDISLSLSLYIYVCWISTMNLVQ